MARGKTASLSTLTTNTTEEKTLTTDQKLFSGLVCAYISKGAGDSQAIKEATRMLPQLKAKLETLTQD